MLYAKLRNDILLTRERREAELQKLLATLTGGSAVQLALNIPGSEKRPAGCEELLCWAQEQLIIDIPATLELFDADVLGPWALYTTPESAFSVKKKCCTIEEKRDFARLLDYDVYAFDGTLFDREKMGFQQRSCLVCSAPARECIRARRHTPKQMKEHLEELLEPLTASGTGRVAYRWAQG